MTNKRTHRIAKLRIGEISMVDEGDNPGAGVLILKRRATDIDILKHQLGEAMIAAGDLAELAAGAAGGDGVHRAAAILKGMDMDMDGLNARLEQIETDMAAVEKRATEAEAEVVILKAAAAEKDAEIEKLKAGPDEDGDDEEILKGLPPVIRDRLLAAEATAKSASEAVEKSRDEAELNVEIGKARDLGLVDPEGVGGLLHRIAKGKATREDADKVTEMLTLAKAQAKAGDRLFVAIGKATGGDANANDAEAKIEEATQAIMKAKPGTNYAAAYDEAITANPGLYEELRKAKPPLAVD